MPTPLLICGAECGADGTGASAGSNGALRHWSTFGAGVTLQSGGGKTGGAWSARSYKFNPAAGTNDQLVHTFAAVIASPASMVVRFRVMFDVLPNAIRTLVGEAAGLGGIRFNPTGNVLEAWAGKSVTTVAGSFAVVVGVWYVVECRVTRDTTCSTEWRVDGLTQTTASAGSNTAASIASVLFGHETTGQGGSAAATGTYYLDDICLSGTSGDYPLRNGNVYGIYPDGDGAHSMTANDLQAGGVNMTNATTNGWASLQNPLANSVASFVAQVVIRTTSFAEFTFGAVPGGVPQAINGVGAVSTNHGSTTGAHTQSLRLRDGASEGVILALSDYSDTSVSYNYKCFATAPSTSAAWTKPLLDALTVRFGYSDDVTGNPRLGGVMLEVDVVPTPQRYETPRLAVPRAAFY